MKRMWGDQFYNAKEKKWNKSGGEGYSRGFCQLVLDPIFKVSSVSEVVMPVYCALSTFSRFLIPS